MRSGSASSLSTTQSQSQGQSQSQSQGGGAGSGQRAARGGRGGIASGSGSQQQHNRKGSNPRHGHGHGQGHSAASSTSAVPNHAALSSLLGTELELVLVAKQGQDMQGGGSAVAGVGGKGKDASTAVTPDTSVVSGQLWCYDAPLGCLVLCSPATQSYRIVRLNSIASVSVLSSPVPASEALEQPPAHPQEIVTAVDLNRVREREAQGVRDELRRMAREPPPGVSELGKEIFDALGKTMGVRWASKAM